MTLILDLDVDILKIYLCTKNEVSRSKHSKGRAEQDRHVFATVTLALTR